MDIISPQEESIVIIIWILGVLVLSLIVLFTWIINKLFDHDTKIALKGQNDESVKETILEIKKLVNNLLEEFNDLKIDMAKHWKDDKI